MNCKKIMFVFLLGTSSVMLASNSDQLKKSTLVVFGTYAALSVLDVVFPMESSVCSNTCASIGLLATVTTIMANDDFFSKVTTAGLVGYNLYARTQGGSGSPFINRCDKSGTFNGSSSAKTTTFCMPA
jgi:hypothetical protein